MKQLGLDDVEVPRRGRGNPGYGGIVITYERINGVAGGHEAGEAATKMMPPEFRALLERYCALGRLLPTDADVADVADAKVVLAEMRKVEAEIAAMIARAR